MTFGGTNLIAGSFNITWEASDLFTNSRRRGGELSNKVCNSALSTPNCFESAECPSDFIALSQAAEKYEGDLEASPFLEGEFDCSRASNLLEIAENEDCNEVCNDANISSTFC